MSAKIGLGGVNEINKYINKSASKASMPTECQQTGGEDGALIIK